MSARSKLLLDELKDNISRVSPWPDVWRRAVETNWVLGRINQACDAKPFSRAFFKLVEIAGHSSLLDSTKGPLCSVHLGEAPGGFFQAFAHCRGHPVFGPGAAETFRHMLNDSPVEVCQGDRSWIVSLPSDVWPAELLPTSGFRNIVNFDIFEDVAMRHSFCEKLSGAVDFVTADGGFEVQAEKRREQEEIMYSLLCAETEMALSMLRNGGIFVIKFFALDLEKTRRLLVRIAESFRTVHLQIPVASKPTNDERYVVARGFYRQAPLPEALSSEWQSWFDAYCIEDKLRQFDPINAALELCRTLTTETRLPVEPALGNEKTYCAALGLPVKNVARPSFV
jgi:23S rRNA U2552 (ribose-2'-O)-methylase RlmE/FtsJ